MMCKVTWITFDKILSTLLFLHRPKIDCRQSEQDTMRTFARLCVGKKSCDFITNYATLPNPCYSENAVPFLVLDYRCICKYYSILTHQVNLLH